MNIPVIYGSVRRERRGIHGARFVVSMLKDRGHEVPLIDPLEYPLPLLDLMYKEYDQGEAPEVMESLARIHRAADAFIFITGEYNHGIPPALKNQIDHFLESWFWRPAGIACYSAGPFGGVRAAMQMRCVLGEIGLVTVPSILAMPRVGQSFADDGTPSEAGWERRAEKFLAEIEWYAEALATQRDKKGVPYS
jgi:NAD(P)H-dependent FMN reductase